MPGYPPLLANETLMCAHGGKVDLSAATKTQNYKFENSNCVLKSELMQASISGCPMQPPPNGPGPCMKVVMIPPTSLAKDIQVGDAKGDPPVLTNVAGMMTDRGAPVQYVPAGQRKVSFGMQPGTDQAAKASVEAGEAHKAAEAMDAAEAAGQKIKELSIRDVFWKNAEGEVITRAHIGDTVYLCARLKHCEESKVHVEIWEKDFDNSDDLIEEIKDIKLKKSKLYRKEKDLKREWTVVYVEDDDDRTSSQELEEYGYTLPEYYFVFRVKDNEGKEVKSHSSLVLEVGEKKIITFQSLRGDKLLGTVSELSNGKIGTNVEFEVEDNIDVPISNLSTGQNSFSIY